VSEKKRTSKKRTGSGRGGQGRGGQGGGQGRRSAGRGGRGQPPGGVDETVAELAGPLRKVLDRLPETQRKVLELRMGLVDGHPHDLGDTARTLGLSLSEARDIEKRAFEHIREAIPLQQLQRFLQR
jgi:DNA-directed RNA polymerase specialized sigma24 family protein